MVWSHELETRSYYVDSFNENLFPAGYTDYYIVVGGSGEILDDTYNASNKGKKFNDIYNILDWRRAIHAY
jgi:hypothetical protein